MVTSCGAADVDDFSDRFFVGDQAQNRLNAIAHVAEAARLLAGAVDGDGLIGESLADKIRKHHAVAARLPRADGIEEPGDR